MLRTKILVPVFTVLSTGFFSSVSQAQLTVLANGNVGIGTAAPTQKLDVVLNAADPATEAGRFANNSTTTSFKYGIRNTVSNAGTGSRYGLYNDVQTLSTATGTSYGIYNNSNPGAGGSYGLYNYTNSGGTGFKYGQLNYTFQNSTSTTLSLGIYNYTTTYAGYLYGLYNYSYIGNSTNANTQYGQYNYQYSVGTGTHYGIYNYVYTGSSTTAGTRYGIYSEVPDIGTGIRYGVFARALGAANFAGYFDGNVQINGNFTVSSDDKLKKNFTPVKNAIDMVKNIDPQFYEYRSDIKGMKLPAGEQIGLLASNVEKVLPNLVSEVKAPLAAEAALQLGSPEEMEKLAKNGEAPVIQQQNGESYITYKAVNYLGMIPVLLQAVKDQQQMIEKLQQQLQEQKAVISRLLPAGK